MDGFAWLSALLVAVIGALVVFFATCDSRGRECAGYFAVGQGDGEATFADGHPHT